MEYLNCLYGMRQLKILAIKRNRWVCDLRLLEFIRFNLRWIDFKNVICGDWESWIQKHNRYAYSIINRAPNGLAPEWLNPHSTNEIIRPIDGRSEICNICPSDCDCMIRMRNTTILYDCIDAGFKNIPSRLMAGKEKFPLIQTVQFRSEQSDRINE